jgi:hypothetical protein
MINTTAFANLIDGYNATSYTHNYIMGFCDRNSVYMVVTDSSVLPYATILDKASRGAGYSLRFKPNKMQKEYLKVNGQTSVLCSKEYFEDICAESKYNRGEIFEKLVTEWFGLEWTKDNVPYTDGGDIEVNGIAYQIKFEKATFTNEKSLARILA